MQGKNDMCGCILPTTDNVGSGIATFGCIIGQCFPCGQKYWHRVDSLISTTNWFQPLSFSGIETHTIMLELQSNVNEPKRRQIHVKT